MNSLKNSSFFGGERLEQLLNDIQWSNCAYSLGCDNTRYTSNAITDKPYLLSLESVSWTHSNNYGLDPNTVPELSV